MEKETANSYFTFSGLSSFARARTFFPLDSLPVRILILASFLIFINLYFFDEKKNGAVHQSESNSEMLLIITYYCGLRLKEMYQIRNYNC